MLNLESAILRQPSVVSSDTIVLSAIEQMSEREDSNRLSCVVVLEAEKVLGVFTERDVLRLVSQQQPIDQLTLRQVLTQPPITLLESALPDVAAILTLMTQHQIAHLPLINDQHQLTGIVTEKSLQQLLITPAQLSISAELQATTAQLAEREQQLSSFMDNLPGFVYRELNDPNYTPVYVSPGVVAITGYEAHEYLIDRSVSCGQLIYPEDADLVWQTVQSALASGRSFECEYRITDKWGQIKWLWERGGGTFDQAGQLQYVEGFITDITDRKRTEFLLASQNTILEQIAKAEPMREILTHLLQTIETYIPGSSCSIMLCQDGWLCSTVAPSLPQEYLASIARIPIGDGVGSCGTAVYRREVVIVKDIDQDPLWQNCKHLALPYGLCASWSIPIFDSDQNVLGVFGVYYPRPQEPSLTEIETVGRTANLAGIAIERDRSAQALQQLNQELESRIQQRTQELVTQQNHLAALLDNLPHIAWIKDEQSRFIAVNQPFAQVCGSTTSAVVGKTDYDIWPDELAEAYRNDDFQVLKSGQRKVVEEQIYRANDGMGWLETTKTPFRDVDGNLAGTVGIAADITDRKTAEIQLQQTNEELLRATRLKDEFLANMSHELRTPLNAILGMTEGLSDQVFGTVNERQLRALATIERSGSHLLELINDILDLSKIESSHLELDCQPTSVALICQSSLTFVKQQAHVKHITLETNLPPNLPDLMVEERRIRQVVINLLNNAVKFTPEGGQVTLAVQNIRSGFLQISITDTGIGISPENIKKLFQPFVQIDSALNRQYDGTGLGLALVKQIVELHGGCVGLTSEVGVGSCFSIELPCVDLDCSALPNTPSPTADVSVGDPLQPAPVSPVVAPLILLAEDNSANVSTIGSYLTAKGYRLLVAGNGQEAIELVQSARPDLVLMDIQMPGMDGLEAMQEIRRDPQFTNLPMIALTALAMHGDRERCIAAGANDYISKPIKLKNLAQTIRSMIDVDMVKQGLN